jgi:hypothetical protein
MTRTLRRERLLEILQARVLVADHDLAHAVVPARAVVAVGQARVAFDLDLDLVVWF